MTRRTFRVLAALLLGVSVSILTLPAVAQQPGSFATYSGELSNPGQQDSIAFDVDPDRVTVGDDGDVGLVFLLSAADGSALDPGLIQVGPRNEGGVEVGGAQKPDTAGSNASLTLASLLPGEYQVTVRGEHGTTGAYRLDVRLAGDADGDLDVDADDLALIAELSGAKLGDAEYSPLADVDRNGVVNGGDRQRTEANLGAAAENPEPANPLDVFLPAGALQLVGRSANGFNSRSGPLEFSLTGAEFEQELASVTLTINGAPVNPAAITVGANLLSVAVTLANGRNDVALKTYDTTGRPLYFHATLWAGSANLQVRLVNPDGSLFTQPATVSATLSDDLSVSTEAATSTGTVVFPDMPARTILLQAKGSGNEFGTAGVIGTQGLVVIKMLGFGSPSSVDNNDFSQGLAGWDLGTAPVSIVPHVENVPGFPAAAPAPATAASLSAAASLVDNDLRLGTAGEGERSISRTFTSDPGVTGVRIRYRFITSEVPGGYFGSQYNDYFRVALRSQQGGGFASEHNSMNGLGLAAFDYGSGSTDWREVTLPLDSAGDTVQVDVGVANVGDGLYDSQVIVDFVEELRDDVMPALAWNNTQGGLDLTYTVAQELTNDVTIEVFWASGTSYASRLGAAIFTHTVAAGTAAGTYGPERIAGSDLASDPAGVTHLIAASSPTQVGSIADVSVGYGANADAGAVSAGMLDVVRDGLRAAGQSNGTITSTARTPEDQARAMFQNLVNAAHSIAQNIQTQLGIYAAAGDAVINVFADEVDGLTRPQVLANAATIQAAMVTEINNQGPSSVSHHCADPAVVSVVDVTAAPFNANNSPLFVSSVSPRLTRFIDERGTNNCFHLELNR